MSDKSILTELTEELQEARRELAEYKKCELGSVCKGPQILSSYFSVVSEKPLKIAGIGLAVGEWNGVMYTADEIKKLVDQLVGKPLLVEHGRDPQYKGKKVGEFTKAIWNDFVEALLFEAEVTDNLAIRDVLKKRFRAISLSNKMKYVPYDGKVKGVELESIEGSLTENPACDVCYLLKTEQSLSMLNMTIHNKEVDVMDKIVYLSEEEYHIDMPIDFKVTIDDLNKIVEDRVFTRVEELEIETDEIDPETEAKKKRRVRRYYYKYRYYAPYYPPYWYGYYYYYPPYYKKIVRRKSKDGQELTFEIYGSKEELMADEDWTYTPEEKKEEEKSEPLKAVVCPACKQEFPTKEEFDAHWAKEHEEQYGPFEKKTEEQKEEKQKVFVCPACGQELPSAKDFVAHWGKEHAEQYGPFKGKMPTKEEKTEEAKEPEAKEGEVKAEEESKEEKTEEVKAEKSEEKAEEKQETETKEATEAEKKETLRRKRCKWCDELVESIEEHMKECNVYKDVVVHMYKCKYCKKIFNTEGDLSAHLKKCKKYKLLKKEELKEKSTGQLIVELLGRE